MFEITGWSRHPNASEWEEMGASTGITVDPPPLPPEIGLQDVARELNARDARIAALELELSAYKA